jgi:hypothetical protein
VSVYNPVYRVEIWSGSTLRHAFGLNATKYVNSLRVKPGMTTTIGSFEITVPDADLTNNPGMYNNVLPFEDVSIWLGYNQISWAMMDLDSYAGQYYVYIPTADVSKFSVGQQVILRDDDSGPEIKTIAEINAAPGYLKMTEHLSDNYTTGANGKVYEAPDFSGKIETIKSSLDPDQGWVRTFIGRDYGECFHRVIKREAFNTGSTVIVQNIRNNCTGSIYGGLSTSNASIETDTQTGSLTLDNDSCQKGIKEISDFVNRDFYVDTNKVLHWFTRQSQTGSETYTTGSNIFDYTVTKDMSNVINDIYVFGTRNSAGITGSDIPVNHDDWTEADLTGWLAYINSGSGDVAASSGSSDIYKATGSRSINASDSHDFYSTYTYTVTLRKTLPSTVRLSSGDILHLYCGLYNNSNAGPNATNGPTQYLRLETSTSNYFECKLERSYGSADGPTWKEYNINVGATNEGVSTTGSTETNTGSYKWRRVGNPDWFNINSFAYIQVVTPNATNFGLVNYLDGFYLGTKFQYRTGSTSSQTAYGYRPYIYTDERLTSNEYCQNKAGTLLAAGSTPVTQIQLTTTGSPALQTGNRHQINIGSENISDYYELIDIEHNYEGGEFRTTCTFTDKKELRLIVPIINYPVQKAQETLSWWDVLLRQFTRFGPGPYKQYSSP